MYTKRLYKLEQVSTHSRLKAAGQFWQWFWRGYCCFNTQPPEGGWIFASAIGVIANVFQHTAA